MKRSEVISTALLLIVGNNLTHVWGWLPDKWIRHEFDFFLKPGFTYKVSFAWLLKELMDDTNMIFIFFAMGIIVEKYSHLLYEIISVFVFYYFIDAILLLWDFKQTKIIYWVSSIVAIISVYFLLRERKMKVVK